jgi:hypothetical protein
MQFFALFLKMLFVLLLNPTVKIKMIQLENSLPLYEAKPHKFQLILTTSNLISFISMTAKTDQTAIQFESTAAKYRLTNSDQFHTTLKQGVSRNPTGFHALKKGFVKN